MSIDRISIEGKGPPARHQLFYFGGAELGAVRVDNFKYQFYSQPDGWPAPKVTIDMPLIYNIRQDPFERTPIQNFAQGAPAFSNEFFGREAWRFVLVQDVVAQLGQTAIDYPPMQAPASFNLTAVKERSRRRSRHAKASSRHLGYAPERLRCRRARTKMKISTPAINSAAEIGR